MNEFEHFSWCRREWRGEEENVSRLCPVRGRGGGGGGSEGSAPSMVFKKTFFFFLKGVGYCFFFNALVSEH